MSDTIDTTDYSLSAKMWLTYGPDRNECEFRFDSWNVRNVTHECWVWSFSDPQREEYEAEESIDVRSAMIMNRISCQGRASVGIPD